MRTLPLVLLTLAACKDVATPATINDNELVTTVELSLGAEIFLWEDLEADGNPTVDPITLPSGESRTVAVRFLNALEDPPEDITLEVAAESDEHQVFYDGVDFTYGDTDSAGLPVGLVGTLTAETSGTLTVLLQHLPDLDGTPQKAAGLAEDFAAQGATALPGDTDVSVAFPLTVP